jgi:hypothetical protein
LCAKMFGGSKVMWALKARRADWSVKLLVVMLMHLSGKNFSSSTDTRTIIQTFPMIISWEKIKIQSFAKMIN